MKKAQLDYFLKELNDTQEAFWQNISDLGAKIREQVIIPVCKRNKLEFTSGMGRFFFTTQNGQNYGESWELEGNRLQTALKPVFALLNQEITHNQYLGFFVSDVRKADYE